MTIEEIVSQLWATEYPDVHPLRREQLLRVTMAREVFLGEFNREALAKESARAELRDILGNVARECPELVEPVPNAAALVRLEESGGVRHKDLGRVTRLRQIEANPALQLELAASLKQRDPAAYAAAVNAKPEPVAAAPLLTAAEQARAIADSIGSDSAIKRRSIERSILDSQRLENHAATTLANAEIQKSTRGRLNPNARLTAHRLAQKGTSGPGGSHEPERRS